MQSTGKYSVSLMLCLGIFEKSTFEQIWIGLSTQIRTVATSSRKCAYNQIRRVKTNMQGHAVGFIAYMKENWEDG